MSPSAALAPLRSRASPVLGFRSSQVPAGGQVTADPIGRQIGIGVLGDQAGGVGRDEQFEELVPVGVKLQRPRGRFGIEQQRLDTIDDVGGKSRQAGFLVAESGVWCIHGRSPKSG